MSLAISHEVGMNYVEGGGGFLRMQRSEDLGMASRGVEGSMLTQNDNNDTATSHIESELGLMQASACSALHDEPDELQWIADYSYEGSASVSARSWSSQAWSSKNAPLQRSILNMDLSYEDFSKNMDANLAQIDMETFRSEDINTAILSLQRVAGEECASLSASLIDELPIDSSQRVNEICRKTPLFSPLKEAGTATVSHISMADSLDCSYHGDLVLTCRATNKNNYTLAFEQSQVMTANEASDEGTEGSNSDMAASSDTANWHGSDHSHRGHHSGASGMMSEGGKPGMVHSELGYTTWSRVSGEGGSSNNSSTTTSKNEGTPVTKYQQSSSSSSQTTSQTVHEKPQVTGPYVQPKCGGGKKCHSLPDLMKRSMTGQMLQRASCQMATSPMGNTLYTINDCQVVEDLRSGVPLLRMFMDKGRHVSSGGLSAVQALSGHSNHFKTSISSPDAMQCSSSSMSDASAGGAPSVGSNTPSDTASNPACPSGSPSASGCCADAMTDSISLPVMTTVPIFTAKTSHGQDHILHHHPSSHHQSANGLTNVVHHVRARQNLDNTLNNNVVLDDSTALSEEDSSQCFEDSLVGILATQGGHLNGKKALLLASPIREEEEHLASSCDEPMREINSSNSSEDSRNQSPPYEQGKPPITPKINNYMSPNSRGSSLPRKELVGSESSGYISRQNSNDQINKSPNPNAHQFLLCSGNRRSAAKQMGSNSGSSGMLQCSTQVRTVAIQTGSPCPSPQPSGSKSTSANPTPTHQSEHHDQCHVITPQQLTNADCTPIKKSIYVCYPNYSLPDLSFLKDIKPGHAVVLQPTEIGQTNTLHTQSPMQKECEHTSVAAAVGTPSRRRAQSSEPKCRPKSYNDYEALLRNGVDKIKDWESLSLLLPDDVKMMVKQMRGDLPVRMRDKSGRSPRPLRIDQICGDYSGVPVAGTTGYEEVYVGGGTGVGLHLDEKDGLGHRRHSLLNLPSLTGLIPTGLDLNAVTNANTFVNANIQHSRDGGSNGSSASCCCGRSAKKAVSFSDNLYKGIGEHRTPSTCGCRNFALNLQLHDASNPSQCYSPGSIGSAGRGVSGSGGPLREHTPQGLSPSGFVSPLTHSQHELVATKRILLDTIYNAIRQVVDAYGKDKEKDSKMQLLNDDSLSGKEVLKSLLPAIEQLIGDGLLVNVRGLFGPLPNSKWHLVESMVQTKEGRKEVRELLDYIHSVNASLDESAKFKCFVLGLINLGCLDTWITLLLATSSVQQKHYSTTAFLPLLSHYSFFFLQEELVSNLRILSELPFAFNLNFSAKVRPSAATKEHDLTYVRNNGSMDRLYSVETESARLARSRVQSPSPVRYLAPVDPTREGSRGRSCPSKREQTSVASARGPGRGVSVGPSVAVKRVSSPHIDAALKSNGSAAPSLRVVSTNVPRVPDRIARSKTDMSGLLQGGRQRPVSYPAALKKEAEPPQKDTRKFRQLRTQWEKMSGALPNRPNPHVAVSGNLRVNQSDNLRKSSASSAAKSRPVSSPQRGMSSQTASPQKSNKSSQSSSQGGAGDNQNVVLVRKSLIPIRGWSAKQQSSSTSRK